jgi:predicted CopG family antitoxin
MNQLNDLQHNKLKTIVLSEKNYNRLKILGYTSESFNDVLNRLLENVKEDRQ